MPLFGSYDLRFLRVLLWFRAKKCTLRNGAMAQSFTARAVLPEVLSSIPSKVAHDYLWRDLVPSSGVQVYMQAEHCIRNK